MHRPKSTSTFDKRLSRSVAATCACCAILYLVAFLWNYENNFLIFIANVFAPALLLLISAATLITELYGYSRGRAQLLRDRLVRGCLIFVMLIPTVAGELRSHEQPPRTANTPTTQLSVLDVNLLGPRNVADGFYEEIARRRPDIITVQELNPTVAQRLLAQFGATYMCQHLEPQPGVMGMGILAKFPCVKRESPRFMPGIGLPQIVDLTLPGGTTIGVINVHTIPPHTLLKHKPSDNELQQLSNSIIHREAFVKKIIEDSRAVATDAAILAGDFNATARNRVYRIVREMGFYDTFAVGSRVSGGTWPGPDFPLPSWLVRIDFIFHSAALRALHAETLAEGYGSDHRGVFATVAVVQ